MDVTRATGCLTSLAFNMKCALREGDTLARLGGDEFVAVMLDLDNAEASAPVAGSTARGSAEPVQVGDLSLRVSASIRGHVSTRSRKRQMRICCCARPTRPCIRPNWRAGTVTTSSIPIMDQTVAAAHGELEHIRHMALAAREFVLYYQPKVNMAHSAKVVGAEALIDGNIRSGGCCRRVCFCRSSKIMRWPIEVGEWVIDSALPRWSPGMPPAGDSGQRECGRRCSLQQADFVDRLSNLLAAHPRVKPFSLEIEVLETSALAGRGEDLAGAECCRGIGVSFALDDFGNRILLPDLFEATARERAEDRSEFRQRYASRTRKT